MADAASEAQDTTSEQVIETTEIEISQENIESTTINNIEEEISNESETPNTTEIVIAKVEESDLIAAEDSPENTGSVRSEEVSEDTAISAAAAFVIATGIGAGVNKFLAKDGKKKVAINKISTKPGFIKGAKKMVRKKPRKKIK